MYTTFYFLQKMTTFLCWNLPCTVSEQFPLILLEFSVQKVGFVCAVRRSSGPPRITETTSGQPHVYSHFSATTAVIEEYLCRRALQIQLVSLYCELGQWKNSLKLGASILPELKK
jgi:hypothetical protein